MKERFLLSSAGAYLCSRIRVIALFAAFVIIFSAVFFLYRINTDAILYACILCAIPGIIYLIFDFSRFSSRHRILKNAAAHVAASIDDLPLPSGAVEEDYDRLVRLLYRSRNELLNESAEAKSQLIDYYALWVHQIKVPISAMHMLLQDEPKSSPLHVELFKIEQYVEMALSYVRLESEYTDYVIRECELDSIVKSAVRKYAPLFISKKISLDISDTDLTVITDEKWLQFVLEQILSNSLKYTKTGSISIYYEAPATVAIEDTGIGIAPEDIPRIGEKGFTGYNGRIHRKSTGLGLYLSREILRQLSHTMEISSEVGRGTTVRINLSTRSMMVE